MAGVLLHLGEENPGRAQRPTGEDLASGGHDHRPAEGGILERLRVLDDVDHERGAADDGGLRGVGRGLLAVPAGLIEAAVVFSKGGSLTMEDLDWAGFSQEGSQQGLLPGLSGLKPSQLSLPEYLERQERELIMTALHENNWVQKDAAEQLGISPRVLCYKIKKLKIDSSSGAV